MFIIFVKTSLGHLWWFLVTWIFIENADDKSIANGRMLNGEESTTRGHCHHSWQVLFNDVIFSMMLFLLNKWWHLNIFICYMAWSSWADHLTTYITHYSCRVFNILQVFLGHELYTFQGVEKGTSVMLTCTWTGLLTDWLHSFHLSLTINCCNCYQWELHKSDQEAVDSGPKFFQKVITFWSFCLVWNIVEIQAIAVKSAFPCCYHYLRVWITAKSMLCTM